MSYKSDLACPLSSTIVKPPNADYKNAKHRKKLSLTPRNRKKFKGPNGYGLLQIVQRI